jgi:hypothetical protein
LRFNKHLYSHDTIVIGGGLNALLYSFFGGYPCLCVEPDVPFRFDFSCEKDDFGFIGVHTGNLREAWEKLAFILSLSGQLPMGDKVVSLNVLENILKASTRNSKLARFSFKKLVVFDDRGVTGLPTITRQDIGKSRVIDWFDVRSGMEHKHDFLETEDDFIKKVFFYPSERFGSQKSGRMRKDLVAVSYLDPDQLTSFDYSDTMARFKITQMMKDAGIRGARNGRDTKNPNIYRYYSPKIESVERGVTSDIKNYYIKDDRFEFLYDTPAQVIEKYFYDSGSYASKINKILIDN